MDRGNGELVPLFTEEARLLILAVKVAKDEAFFSDEDEAKLDRVVAILRNAFGFTEFETLL